MNSVELHHPNGKPCGVWQCLECRTLYGGTRDGDRGKEQAEACCKPVLCSECQQPISKKYHKICDACDDKQRNERAAKYLAEAEKLTECDGPVWLDGVGPHDGFFPSLEDLMYYLDYQEEKDWPEYVHTCTPVPFKGIDPMDSYERVVEEMWEDAIDDLQGKEEFEQACRDFNAANKTLIGYDCDYKRAVKVPKREELK